MIRTKIAKNETVTPQDIDEAEQLAEQFIYQMLHAPLDQLIFVEQVKVIILMQILLWKFLQSEEMT